MTPIEQSRIGDHGTCFRACLASVLDLPEERMVPDFPLANEDPGVDRWLGRRYGLRYVEMAVDTPPPVGWHLMLGLSPRGGQHAVVGYDGQFVHDPHPAADDPRRGLRRVERWGVLLPVGRRRAGDSALGRRRNMFIGRPTAENLREARALVAELEAFLRDYPGSEHAEEARRTLREYQELLARYAPAKDRRRTWR